jgi:hypothetical protein
MGGMRLVKNAKISSLISETTDYVTEYNAFYDRYEAYPGDLSSSQAGGGGDDASAVFGSSDIGENTIHYGNGDGLIGNADADTNTNDNTYEDTESSGFFHHLTLAGISTTPAFTGNEVVPGSGNGDGSIDDITEVEINTNFPGTKFGSKTFFYVASSDVGGRYNKQNRIILATKDATSINSMTPNDAESVDIKKDDGNPFKGQVVAHNASMTNGLTASDIDGNTECTNIDGYATDSSSTGCVLEISLDAQEEKLTSTFAASGIADAGTTPIADRDNDGEPDGDGTADDCIVPLVSSYTGIASWNVYLEKDRVKTGTEVVGDCDSGYAPSGAGEPNITCTNGSWGGMVGSCSTTCTVPALPDATNYPNITAWTNTTAEPNVTVANPTEIDSGTTIKGTCDFGYAGTAETICNNGVFGALSEECTQDACYSGPCSNTNYYCGSYWSGQYCDNNITGGGVDTSLNYISGDCYINCTNTTFSNDTISTAIFGFGDCYYGCSGTMGNDLVRNMSDSAFGDCSSGCSGIMGNDAIENSGFGSSYGDCSRACSGTMGNDEIIGGSSLFGDCSKECNGTMGKDTITGDSRANFLFGDCQEMCSGITQWGTDKFVYNSVSDSSSSYRDRIYDFNAGGIDDKIMIPNGATSIVLLNISSNFRTLQYTLSGQNGMINVSCNNNPGYHDCDGPSNNITWGVKACNIYVGGSQISAAECPNCDTGTCNFND